MVLGMALTTTPLGTVIVAYIVEQIYIQPLIEALLTIVPTIVSNKLATYSTHPLPTSVICR